MRYPTWPTPVPEHFVVGSDIEADMEPPHLLPSWDYNEQGSPFVPNLGKVSMKHVAFEKVAAHSFQTSLWLGNSIPSKSSQLKQFNRSRGKGSKGKQKGEGSKGKKKKSSTAVADSAQETKYEAKAKEELRPKEEPEPKAAPKKGPRPPPGPPPAHLLTK